MKERGEIMGIGKSGVKRAVSGYGGFARGVAASLCLVMAAASLSLAARRADAASAPPAAARPSLPRAPAGSPSQQDWVGGFHLYVGEARVIKLPRPVVKTAIGNGKVLSIAALDANELLMIASDAGRSTLHLWLENGSEVSYAVEVAADSPSKIYAQVKEAFGENDGIRASLVGNRVFLQARTLTPGQANLVKALQQAFDDKIVLITEGDVALEERTVYVNAQLIEIKKSALEELGVAWSETIHGPSFAVVGDMRRLREGNGDRRYLRPESGGSDGVPSMEEWPGYTRPFRMAFSLATLITSRINLLRSQGNAYVVAEPRLTARCGGKADFTSGGEMPIPVQSGLGSTSVEFKKYGVRLSVEPQCDKLGNIRARVATEVSQIDEAVSVLGVPGLLTRQAESELDLVDGRAMLLSGLASYEAGRNENKVPFLGNLPLLGNLFKNTGASGGRSELIVIITPSFVTSESEVIRKSVQRGGQMIGETEESLSLDRELAPLDAEEKEATASEEAGTEGAATEFHAPARDASPPRRVGYSVTGEASWRPLRVYSDGRRTVIEMPPGIPAENAPALLVIQPGAAAEAPPVRYRLEDSRYVVDGVLDRAVLVAGSGLDRESVTIERQP